MGRYGYDLCARINIPDPACQGSTIQKRQRKIGNHKLWSLLAKDLKTFLTVRGSMDISMGELKDQQRAHKLQCIAIILYTENGEFLKPRITPGHGPPQ